MVADADPTSRTVDQLWAQVDAFLDAPDQPVAALGELADRAVASATELADAELWFIGGYLLYLLASSEGSEDALQQARRCLRESLNVEPQHARARMYLGHIEYDADNFSAAIHHFDHVDGERLARPMQLKLSELRLCSFVRLHGWCSALPRLLHFARTVEESDPALVHAEQLRRTLRATNIEPRCRERVVAAIERVWAVEIAPPWMNPDRD